MSGPCGLVPLVRLSTKMRCPLTYKVISECSTTKARVGLISLVHSDVDTPVFMPVGTQGTLKGVLPDQLINLNCQIILGNTYHLGQRPGIETLRKAGGLHKFMGWNRALLTDSGGFQMVSLLKLAEIDENGVNFKSPFDESNCLLTPEHSIEIQNVIGADIVMQLDDVVKTTTQGPRVEEAMHRTIRWLDRCLEQHSRDDEQSIFPIVQGGLDPKLREECAGELTKRKVRGFAVGGLRFNHSLSILHCRYKYNGRLRNYRRVLHRSGAKLMAPLPNGGESKDEFWRTVHLCTNFLPKDKPRYLMGVGFAADLVVCVSLGIDMFDCVFPTRTARFGCALVRHGQLNLKQSKYAADMKPIDEDCDCSTCTTYTRSYLHHIATFEAVSCSLLTVHNVAFQLRLMNDMRDSIKADKFPQFVKTFMKQQYPDGIVPQWIIDALNAVGISLDSSEATDS